MIRGFSLCFNARSTPSLTCAMMISALIVGVSESCGFSASSAWFSMKYSGFTSLPMSWKYAHTRAIAAFAPIASAAASDSAATTRL